MNEHCSVSLGTRPTSLHSERHSLRPSPKSYTMSHCLTVQFAPCRHSLISQRSGHVTKQPPRLVRHGATKQCSMRVNVESNAHAYTNTQHTLSHKPHSARTGRTVFLQLSAAVVRHKANDGVAYAIRAWFKYDTAALSAVV